LHERAVKHEGDKDQQFNSREDQPNTASQSRLGAAAGVESVSRGEWRANKQDARTEQGERMSSAEKTGQHDAEWGEHHGKGKCSPT